MDINSKSDLKEKIEELKKAQVSKTIENRMKEFEDLNKKGNKEWFNELCFCLLTANSTAELAIEIQNFMIRKEGFTEFSEEKITKILKQKGHRFYNRRAEYIILARKHQKDIKTKIESIKDQKEARKWVVDKIKGIGYKEGSHFLRNVGYKKLGILDRHILRILEESKIIEIPKTLTKKRYLNIEQKFISLANEVDLDPGELDLYLWYTQTGEVLK